LAGAGAGMSRVGLMLYTVRDECARDLEGVLRAVAEIGYEGVELFDLHGHDAAQVRSWLDGFGLVAAGRHAGLDALESDLPVLAEELRTLGCDRIALSWIDPPESSDDARAIVARIAEVARQAAAHGLRFGFHNHWSEVAMLDDADTVLDKLRALPAELVWLELDLGWIWEAGVDPVDELERTAGRCPLVHVKDFQVRGTRKDCPVGDGDVGYDHVLPAAVSAGAEWLVVEQDNPAAPALAAVERSFDAVRRMVRNGT
jgi:sugar phosphate isomerase/epimerase